MRKVFNNIYVKNFPVTLTEDDLRKIFSAHGEIASIFIKESEIGKFAFICYTTVDAAIKAVESMNDADMGEPDKKLYVSQALNKTQRETEKIIKVLKFKNAKKRCNLYVKNFDPETKEEDLTSVFSQYGEVENIKLYSNNEGKKTHAFVCFKGPEFAAAAKQGLHGTPFNGRNLYINNYEIREVRAVQLEAI